MDKSCSLSKSIVPEFAGVLPAVQVRLYQMPRPKIIRQQRRHRRLPHRPLSIHNPHRRVRLVVDELAEHLPARAAGRDAVGGADGQRQHPPPARAGHRPHGVALGADSQAIGAFSTLTPV